MTQILDKQIEKISEKTVNLVPDIGSEYVKYEPAEPSKVSAFRINAKNVFLTYVKTNLKPLEALYQLQTKFPSKIVRYSIGQGEDFENLEKSKNLYVFLEFNGKIQLSSLKKLDLRESEKIIEANLHLPPATALDIEDRGSSMTVDVVFNLVVRRDHVLEDLVTNISAVLKSDRETFKLPLK